MSENISTIQDSVKNVENERTEWVSPSVKRLSAGEAEAGGAGGSDGPIGQS